MTTITPQDFRRLATQVYPHCVSIYIPTHKYGQEVNNHHDKLLFKNKLSDVKSKLTEFELTENEIADYLRPAERLLDDTAFWHNLSEGLVVFISPENIEYYSLPFDFNEFVYVSNHFYTSPLISYFSESSEYYLLTLSENETQLFKCNRYQIEEINTQNILPARLEEVVGYDFQEKYSSARTQHAGSNRNGYKDQRHGQGEGKDDVKLEYEKYFTEVNNGIVTYLHDKKAPLVVATTEYLHSIYKKVNHYKYLYPDYLSGNPDYENQTSLHLKATTVIEDFFHKKRNSKKFVFNEAIGRTSIFLKDIVSGAVNGKVDTLFVEKGKQIFGQFDKHKDKVYVHNEKRINNACLVNLAATETFLQGGEVFILRSEEMPYNDSVMNGLFRY